jgi:hypothetical protein
VNRIPIAIGMNIQMSERFSEGAFIHSKWCWTTNKAG